MQEAFSKVHLSASRVKRILLALAALNVFFIAGTAFSISTYPTLPADSLLRYLVIQLNLDTENVVAAWYSSMLLLLVAVAALVCFFADRAHPGTRRERTLSLGWLVLAVIFAGLSFDELGALHERLGAMPELNPWGDYPLGWVRMFAIPIAVMGAFILAFTWFHVRRVTTAGAGLITLGLLMFGTIPFQERLEKSFLMEGGLAMLERPVLFAVLEEGTEIFAMLAFLAGMGIYATVRSRTAADDSPYGVVNTSLSPGHARWGGAVALLGLAVGLVVAMLLFSPGRVPHSESAFWTALFFKGAVQSYDAELAAAFASPDLVLRIHPPPAGESGVYAGRESLRGWIRHAQRENLSFERYFILPEGNTVTFRGSSSQPDWAEQGIEARRTNTEVVVENGKVREFVLNFEPPIEEIPVAAENWFASALAALAALVALQRKDSAVRQNITSRAPYRALAAFCLLVSVYFGANVYAYNNWGAVDLARLGLIELLRAGAIGVAIWMALRMEAPTWSRVAIVIWALLFGAGFGLGMAYIVPLAVAGLAVLLLALLPQFHGSPESAPGGMEQPLGQGQRLEAEPSVR